MPLIPYTLKHVQQAVQITDLCKYYNIELQPYGNKFYGYCPFHEDSSLSLIIDLKTNRWRCRRACCIGGDVVRFVMKLENISFVEAVKKVQSFIETKPSINN